MIKKIGLVGAGVTLVAWSSPFNPVRSPEHRYGLTSLHLHCQSSSSPKESRDIFKEESPSTYLQTRSFSSLLRSYLVLKACQSSLLISLTPSIIKITESLPLFKSPFYFFVRHSFFAQFCGGEGVEECVAVQNGLRSVGINSILDLSIEAHHSDTTPQQSVMSEHADLCKEMIKSGIRTAAQVSGNSFAVKSSALSGAVDSLIAVSASLAHLRDLFEVYATTSGDNDGLLDERGFKSLVEGMPGYHKGDENVVKIVGADSKGRLDWFGVREIINLRSTPHLFIGKCSLPSSVTTTFGNRSFRSCSATYQPPACSLRDLEEFKAIYARLSDICDYAKEKQVSIMIDAEQSYIQPAIDELALELMKKYNRNGNDAPVYNTYQMYLKDSFHFKLQTFQRVAEKYGFVHCAKLVRGAYMHTERKRAMELGLRDPIHDSLADTHSSYDSAVQFLMTLASKRERSDEKVRIVVASHNKDSILRAIQLMKEYGIDKSSPTLQFAQLLGMHDHLTFTLARRGYSVAKYVPYGPVYEVIPYLTRRAQENHAIFTVSNFLNDNSMPMDDLNIIWREIKTRLGFS